jgi:FKBP-type peptidyl-prolyl cis-trans isomerase SlyD
MIAEPNHVVAISYTLRDDSGNVVDTNAEYAALEYLHGAGNIIDGLESGLAGLKAGDEVSLTILPEHAYGFHDDEKIYNLPREEKHSLLKPGHVLQLKFGQEVTVVGLGNDFITVDENHPLAGKTLYFEVKIVQIREATPQELESGFSLPAKEYCGPPGCC